MPAAATDRRPRPAVEWWEEPAPGVRASYREGPLGRWVELEARRDDGSWVTLLAAAVATRESAKSAVRGWLGWAAGHGSRLSELKVNLCLPPRRGEAAKEGRVA